MTRTNSLQNAVMLALLGGVALVGCKKNDADVDSTASNATPAATEAPAPMTGTAPPVADTANTGASVNVAAVTVGKTAAADKSVANTALFAPRDDIIVSVRTDGTASNANVGAKLTFQDGQVAGEQSATLNTSGTETTNITFKNANGWPAGKYRAEVVVDGRSVGTPQEFEVR